ncbi:MAG TPA: DUF1778 domain-containing protein [Jatrophihabitans sp.]|uniref:type II toxin-antitoxin system TacA family antitoxin n=1 Tax=Jatrophihabitans sp. TaxID=1932789 RepID=UPI002EE7454C
MATAARLNFRVRPDTEHRLRAAAAATDQSLTDFVISSAEARAEEVLASRTLVPADYFDQLIAALDEPVTPNEALRTLARRPRRVKQA